jgi:hypothetical protein
MQRLCKKTESRASGNFQWAVLVLKNVRGLSRRGFRLQDIQSEVRRIPKDISDLYYELLKSIKEGPPEERRRSVRPLQLVCFGFESLTNTTQGRISDRPKGLLRFASGVSLRLRCYRYCRSDAMSAD